MTARFIFIILIFPTFCFSQVTDLTGYSLGFISDYMGRTISKGDEKTDYSIGSFFQKENMEYLLRMDTLVKTHNLKNDKINYQFIRRNKQSNCATCHKFFDLISKELSISINKYYDFKKDKENSNKKIKRFNGRLKSRKIISSNKEFQISFLAGAFYRYGDLNDEGYYIKISNSRNKVEILKQILKQNGCTIIKEFDNQKEGLHISPWIITFYFSPSEEIKDLLNYELNMKILLVSKSPSDIIK